MQYCHEKFIVYRDLKAENLPLGDEMNIKIADFVFSKRFTFGNQLNPFCGSLPYASPELFQGQRQAALLRDVWILTHPIHTAQQVPTFWWTEFQEAAGTNCNRKYCIPFYLSMGYESLLKKMYHSQSQQERHFRESHERSMNELGSWKWGTKALH